MPILDIDFTGAPPAQGGGASDLIPNGMYLLRVTSTSDNPSGSGKPMVTIRLEVAQGPNVGARLVDRFVLEKFGKQRFHAFIQAFGVDTMRNGGQVRIELDNLVNQFIEADVRQTKQAASADGQYPERMVSEVQSYYVVGTAAAEEQRKAALTAQAATATAPAAAPVAPAPVQVAPVAPAPIASPPAPPVAPANPIEAFVAPAPAPAAPPLATIPVAPAPVAFAQPAPVAPIPAAPAAAPAVNMADLDAIFATN